MAALNTFPSSTNVRDPFVVLVQNITAVADTFAQGLNRIVNEVRRAFRDRELEEMFEDLALLKLERKGAMREASRLAGEELDRRRRPRRAEHQVRTPRFEQLWAVSLLAWR